MDLSSLSTDNGFRLRGQEVSRLETFVDAAFAFSMTMLVIFYNQLPDSAAELREAMRKVPSFVLCFILLVQFWQAHNLWSRRYGLEDRKSTVLSLAFLMVVLVWVYPLRMVISSGLAMLTGGWLPSEISLDKAHWLLDLQTVFMIYGAGYGLLSWLMWRLNRHALHNADALELDARERHLAITDLGFDRIRTLAAAISLCMSLMLLAVPQARLESLQMLGVLVASLPMFVYAAMGAAMGYYGGKRSSALVALEQGRTDAA